MEWYIIFNPDTLVGGYLVIADFHTLRDVDGACWKSTLDFTTITTSDIIVTDFLQRNNYSTIFHKFISDDPITYVKNFQSSHPELFI